MFQTQFQTARGIGQSSSGPDIEMMDDMMDDVIDSETKTKLPDGSTKLNLNRCTPWSRVRSIRAFTNDLRK